MENLWFYIKLGLTHVLDMRAYDHILFLTALTAPFTFKSWKKIVFLATIFTIAHCTSLALSAYGLVSMDVTLIEFLIPVTILATAAFNLVRPKKNSNNKNSWLYGLTTTFFGAIHGFGFSNYFNMLMAEEQEKLFPLFGFATGIEVAQGLIILCVLGLAYFLQSVLKVEKWIFTVILSVLTIGITIPLLIKTFPWYCFTKN